MPKYTVEVQYSVNELIDVEADSAEEAREKVWDGNCDESQYETLPEGIEFRSWLPWRNWPVYLEEEQVG